MTDRESFVRSICEEPADDVRRLTFADWLDEHGEVELAELIRLQVWHGQNWPTHGLNEHCYCRSCKAFRRANALLTLDNRVKWGKPAFVPCCQLRWYRGFIETIELPVQQFMQEAKGIFAAHPVTVVNLVDAIASWDSAVGSVRRAWLIQENARDDEDRPETGYLPMALFKELTRMTNGVVDAYNLGFAVYPNDDAAQEDIHSAAVTLGRKRANLPPLPVAQLPATTTAQR